MKKLKYPLLRTRFPKIRDLGPRAKKRYLVDSRPHAPRRCFNLLTEARALADSVATELANKGTESFTLATGDRVMAASCIARLRPFGKSLDDATNFFVDHLSRERKRKQSLLVSACVAEFLVQLQNDVARGALAQNSYRESKFRAQEISAAFGPLHIAELDERKFLDHLNSRPVSEQTKKNIRSSFSKFVNWCVDRGHIDRSPLTRASKIKVKRGDVQILSVDEAAQLLAAARGEMIPYVSIGLFAGLRPTEIQRLDWQQISLATKTITVLARTTKTRETRYVPINDALLTWLSPFVRPRGKIIGVNFPAKWRRVLRAAGFDHDRRWPQDAMRHSFGSYWLALNKNRAELAELMGNSVQVIKQHYRAPVLESDALAYLALRPNE
ncbi:MAG: tyrosine-type recombinase/integrase [Chthoniobacterales bacterium]